MDLQELDPARRRAPPAERSLLWRFNAALARPVAALFGALGFTAGQLSLQSLTVTLVGLLRLASGEWGHVVQGAFIVYAGLLLDRADHLLAAQKGGPPAWGLFLGLVVDRLVEAGLLVGLAALLARGVRGAPGALPGPWEPLPPEGALVLAAAALATMLVARLAGAYADVLALRTHLLASRRLPGPAILPRGPQRTARLGRLVDRDLLVLAWLAGVAIGQLQLTLLALLAAHVAALGETLALFWHGRKDPEPRASRILSRDYP